MYTWILFINFTPDPYVQDPPTTPRGLFWEGCEGPSILSEGVSISTNRVCFALSPVLGGFEDFMSLKWWFHHVSSPVLFLMFKEDR